MIRIRSLESSEWMETKWEKDEDCAKYLADHVVSHVNREEEKIQTKHVEMYIPLDILEVNFLFTQLQWEFKCLFYTLFIYLFR